MYVKISCKMESFYLENCRKRWQTKHMNIWEISQKSMKM